MRDVVATGQPAAARAGSFLASGTCVALILALIVFLRVWGGD